MLMAGSLVLNPFLKCQPIGGDDAQFLLRVPKAGEGLHDFAISRIDHGELYDIFADFSNTRLEYLNADTDLSDDQRDLLFGHGVLVDANRPPEKPLFSCDLDDITPFDGEFDPADLIVAPSFRFEPFDLRAFASRAEKHLSPHTPSFWIKTPLTEIELGYWISKEDAACIAELRANGPVPDGLDDGLLRRLIAAKAVFTKDLVENESAQLRESIQDRSREFASQKYAVVQGMFPPEQMAAMRNFYRAYVDNGFMAFGDDRVERRYIEHNEIIAESFHTQLAKLIGMIVGETVQPSFAYAVSYVAGSQLPPHTDREQCEYSLSLQVDYQPRPAGDVSPWPIFLEPLPDASQLGKIGVSMEWEQLPSRNGGSSVEGVYLASGDGLIYKGRELVHYRHALPAGHNSTSVIFCFVAKDFKGELS